MILKSFSRFFLHILNFLHFMHMFFPLFLSSLFVLSLFFCPLFSLSLFIFLYPSLFTFIFFIPLFSLSFPLPHFLTHFSSFFSFPLSHIYLFSEWHLHTFHVLESLKPLKNIAIWKLTRKQRDFENSGKLWINKENGSLPFFECRQTIRDLPFQSI